MAEQPPPAMTVRDVAGFLAVDEKTIYRLAQQGKLPGFKVAGTWRFQLKDIQGWIDEQKLALTTTRSKSKRSLS
jgi:excisionase family DNA binding protein